MAGSLKYAHTNIIAKDWRKLSDFYQKALGCIPVLPEREFNEAWFGLVTGIPGAAVEGIHLMLPGYEGHVPTLEIFTYNIPGNLTPLRINDCGFAHIAFMVEDIETVLGAILMEGGTIVGESVKSENKYAGKFRMVYAKDPEGNIVELLQQGW